MQQCIVALDIGQPSHATSGVGPFIFANRTDEFKLALYVDSIFAGDLNGCKSTRVGGLALVGPNTFVPIPWFCKKQIAVARSSSESAVISFEEGLRIEGVPSVVFWGHAFGCLLSHSDEV